MNVGDIRELIIDLGDDVELVTRTFDGDNTFYVPVETLEANELYFHPITQVYLKDSESAAAYEQKVIIVV